ncbi:hypothetical protein PVAG01_04398 [Phlyctema vagabunda]|uniref:Xylanolytic transcriptional activator regulatory domain-containing protein n=1 Tax=Phlyctema vagabunda TaxID=108571 RepID=A0ABR4PP48_9HELO
MLLAILASLSWQKRKLQQSIGKLYIEILSQRFFVNGDYSLDMLQSLLIYITWYQFHIKLPGHQPYRLASLAVTILLELGLDKKPREFQLQQAVSDSNHSSHLVDPARPDSWSAEARRAVIGCYHVAAYTSISYRRLNLMSAVTCVEEMATSLVADKDQPSDSYLVSQIQMMRVVEEMRNTFDYYGTRSPEKVLSEGRIQAYGQVFTAKLNTIKARIQTTSYPTYLRCLYHLADMCLYEVGLYGFHKNSNASLTRVSLLLDFLESCRLYMELVMVSTKEEMRPWTFFDWRQLNFALITTNQVIVALDPSITTAETVTRLTVLVGYLEWAGIRVREVYALDDTRERHFEGLEHLTSLWEATKSWCESLLARATTAQQAPELPQHQVWPAYANMAPNMPAPALSTPHFEDFTAQTANSMDIWSDSGFWWQPNTMPQ